MSEELQITDIAKGTTNVRHFLDVKASTEVLTFHRSFKEYTQTPLADLKNLAAQLGVASIHVKDESYRFGLNAFKVLGGTYAIGLVLGRELGIDTHAMLASDLNNPEARKKLGVLTFVSATDGNHGRGVAWTATQFGHKSVIYMPHGSAQERLDNIIAAGAEASITDLNYDDAVRLANSKAEENGWIMVQDTAWEGYDDIPRWIMEGYTTMAFEAIGQLGDEIPTHVFLQAGVGSMAGGVAGLLANYYGDKKPIITVVEPAKANCIYKTAEAKDGKLHFVTGRMDTIMAGLACGEPNQIGWDVLTETAEWAVSQPDNYAAEGMRVLGNTVGDDPKVISGESGAATMGFVSKVLTDPALADMKARLGLDENSRILLFNTEGDTDRQNYRDIVWQGKYPSYQG